MMKVLQYIEREMMDNDFEEILWKMQEIHSKQPSLRFCQILGNILGGDDHYYLSNGFVLKQLETCLEKN